MKTVRIKLYQNMVNYKIELSYGYVQTYPLPTPSMIRGMVHSLLNLDKYHNFRVSIQGNYASVVTNMQKIYKFDRVRDDKKKGFVDTRPHLYAEGQKTLNQGVMFVDEIVDIELLLHINFDDERLNEQLLDVVKQKTVILGRNEDIACVDYGDTKLVEISNTSKEYRLPYNIYLKPDICKKEQLEGTYYRLPFYYEPVSSFNDKRIFKYIDAVYIAKGNKIQYSGNIAFDQDENLVSFLEI
ncbi:MAG: CRISPR-associated protein Cas5 [Candidatus Omnitrophica bacterium]|nr:CRISPR-associated protein Cas5 [Candidatus Omnitrophota bacterium]